MAATTSLNPSDANKLVLEAYTSGYQLYTPRYQTIFTEREPQRKDEKFSVTASGGDIPEVAEGAAFPTVDITEVGTKAASQLVYKESLPVTTLMQRFDNYGTVVEEARKQGYRARLSMDRIGANVLNNGFSTETTWDGLPLFDDAHLIGNTGQTQDNDFALDLTETNLNTLITALRDQKDHNNQELAMIPRTLVVATGDAKKAFELTASQGAPESANRYSNYFNTLGINVVVWELLSDADAWFLFADKMYTYLRYLVAIEPKVEYIRRPESGNYEYQIEFACVAKAVDYVGSVGSTGA